MVPTLRIISDRCFADISELEEFDSIIIIETVMRFEHEAVSGYLLILTAGNMMQELQLALNP